MGIKEAFKIGKKGREFTKCHSDPDTGELVCNSKRILEDGMVENLADIRVIADAECNPHITDFNEYEDGQFKKLESKVMGKVIGKCKSKPRDF